MDPAVRPAPQAPPPRLRRWLGRWFAVIMLGLAAMIPGPRFYTRNPSTPYLDERTEILLGEMDRDCVPVP